MIDGRRQARPGLPCATFAYRRRRIARRSTRIVRTDRLAPPAQRQKEARHERKNPFDLTGKTALVTGSSMGIGEGVARVLAEAGAHVVISSRKPMITRVAGEFRSGAERRGQVAIIGRMEDIASMAACT